jgi:hypothetical protein
VRVHVCVTGIERRRGALYLVSWLEPAAAHSAGGPAGPVRSTVRGGAGELPREMRMKGRVLLLVVC